jgi:hypothetical protein
MDHLKRSMAQELLQIRGLLQLQVLGQSMLPTIWPGDIVTIERQLATKVAIGEIGLFEREGRFFIHRVKDKLTLNGLLHYRTRGDSASADDPPFQANALLGRVVKIERRNQTSFPGCDLRLYARMLGWILARYRPARNLALKLHLRSTNRRQIAQDKMSHELV